jgi:hypothetical protein
MAGEIAGAFLAITAVKINNKPRVNKIFFIGMHLREVYTK